MKRIPRACASEGGIHAHVYADQRVPPQVTGALTKPSSFGRGASGAGWLVAIVLVAASVNTIGPQSEMPQSFPPSRSQSAAASSK